MFTAWKNETAFDLAPKPAAPAASAPTQVATSHKVDEAGRADAPKDAYSIINEWLTMRGELESDGDILVKGRVDGNLRCRMLIIDKGASVEGTIEAQDVVVRGCVRGTIRTKRIFLEKTAVVDCEIFQESFGAEEGARVKGTLHGSDDKTKMTVVPERRTAALASLAEASVTELFRDANKAPQAAKPSSTLYNMLNTARVANGSARGA
ncbi:MAG: polymer-forming cytoskeletal protein [Hyphomicrobiaceae bacterium]|nr:polymer-forming cytoskeletal protein [Hyphomicrobiaceae bacterium]